MFALLLFIHAGTHALVFLSTRSWGSQLVPVSLRSNRRVPEAGEPSAALLSSCWLLLCAAIAVSAATMGAATPWWPIYTTAVLLGSLVLSVVEWSAVPAAPLGALTNVTLLSFLWASHLLDVML